MISFGEASRVENRTKHERISELAICTKSGPGKDTGRSVLRPYDGKGAHAGAPLQGTFRVIGFDALTFRFSLSASFLPHNYLFRVNPPFISIS
jgi:hypothetical protein